MQNTLRDGCLEEKTTQILKKSLGLNLKRLTIETGIGPAAPFAQPYGDTRYPMLNDEVCGPGSTLPKIHKEKQNIKQLQ